MAIKNAKVQGDVNPDEEGLEAVSFPPIGDDINGLDEEDAIAPTGSTPASNEDDDPVQAKLDAMQARFEAQEARWASREQHNQMVIDQLMHRGQPAETGPEPVNWDDLPDPVEKPDEFKSAIAKKSQQAIEYAAKSAQSSNGQSQSLDQVWNEFKTEHPDLATYESTVQGATALIASEYRAQGLDPARAILSDPANFKSRVAERIKKELKLGDGDNGEGAHPTALRTAGVSGGKKPRGKTPAAAPAKGFIAQMQETQAKHGLI